MFDFLKKKNNNRYEIIVPATSANLGPGFDSLGISFELFNPFYIKRSNKYESINVNESYQNEDNLVIVSAREAFKYLKKKEIPFSLEIKEEIPISRGLGSSASCILAGIIGAMLISDSKLSDEEIVDIATKIEGHPDNIVPAFFCSLTSAFLDSDKVIFTQYDVNNDLVFTALVPPFKVDTREARSVLPESVSYKDAVFSMSRAIAIPKAIELGDLDKLLYLLKDRLHEPYRYKLIEDSSLFIDFAKSKKIPMCISGSGSTLLMISDKSIISSLEKVQTKDKWDYLELKVCKKGTKWVENND